MQAGLIQEENDETRPVPEAEGEANELVDRIRRVAENLDAERLNERELPGLSFDARRLTEIAKARMRRDRKLSSLWAQIKSWEERHAEAINTVEAVARALAALKTQVERGGAKQNTVTAGLDLAELLLSVEARCRETQEKLNQASMDADFATARSLLDALESLNAERDDTCVAIDALVAEPRAEPLPLQTPHVENKAATPEPNTGGPETDPAELGIRAAGLTPDTMDLTEEFQEPDTDQALSPDDETAAPQGSTAPLEDSAGNENVAHTAEQPEGHENGLSQYTADAIKIAMESGRLGIAYHLALAVPNALPSANTVKLVACNYVTDKRMPIGTELSDLAGALMNEANSADDEKANQLRRRDEAVLTTCAALAPALEAPGGLVAQLLSSLEAHLGDMPSLRALTKAAAEVSMTGVDLPASLLREDDTVDKWRERESALRIETTSWLANEHRSTIKYQAATRVWRRMLEDWEHGGRSSLGHMFALLENPAEAIDTKRVSEITEFWRANGEKEIDRVDRENRRRASTKKIEGSARLDLRHKVEQALAFSERWLSLIRERPDRRPAFPTEQAKVLRSAMNDHAQKALAEIDATAIPLGRIAATLLRRYAELFAAAAGEDDERSVSLTDLLHGELLADSSIQFNAIGREASSPLDPEVLQKLLSRDEPDFGEGAVDRARRGDFHGAEAALDFAERSGRIDERIADLSRAKIEEERSLAQQNLEHRTGETSDRLDAAYAAGALTLETYERLRSEMPLADFAEGDAFAGLVATLDRIDDEIGAAQAGRRDALSRSLDTLRRLSPGDKDRVESAINDGLFQIAEDFIERIERGEELPTRQTETDRPFDRFFPHFVERYSVISDEGRSGIERIRNLIEAGESADILDASGLSEDARRDGIGVLNAWVALRDSRTSVNSLRALMKAIGFDDAKVKGSNSNTHGGEKIFLLQSVPVADRHIARLPDFGSRADGRYRMFAIRGRITEEAIIREAGKRDAAGSPPSIVLFLGVLDADARRALARDFSSGDYHPTIVLDEALAAFLAARPHDRLGAFFDCASAFAFSQPFDPDAAEVPPEMFFGRTDARKAILAKAGDTTHFLYGGRRLGKTALLSAIAREYRTAQRDEPKELVALINLKGSGIGENRPTEDLWALFAEQLAEHQVLKPQTVRPESIEKGVRLWLDENQGRRILLLVDEADAFLDAERNPKQRYRVLEQVKRLMEQTERRFKVVFAGLHNVQRAARDANTLFAHLGDAIRIGPMLPETDHDEIQNLIRSPLEALGYRFTSNDSVIRIAAETNYYPALAQQFCKELLKSLRAEANTRNESGPPYPINPETVDRVFNARETRDRIRNLFSWTIQLDPRYEFLTYLIAQKSFDNEDARPQAVPIGEIRDSALSEWREGFDSDSSFWMFEVLLEEMVGLGILREASDKHYAIRTRNLRMLLGNDDEIERRFVDAKGKRPPAIFDPAQFRSTFSDETPSSLTADQESRLLSGRRVVGFVFGTRLAGLDRMADSLLQAAKGRDGHLYIEEVAPASLRRALDRLSRSRKPGTHVVLVDMRGAWDPIMVGQTLAFVGEHDPQNRLIRPVFVCGPEEAWKWLDKPVPTHERVERREIWLSPCALEFTRNWLADRESLAYSSMENAVQAVDHPWPVIVGMAARCKQLESIDEVANAVFNGDGEHHYVSDILISAGAETALRFLSTFSEESMTADFLSDLSLDEVTPMSPEELVEILDWADRLGIVHRDGIGYRLDSTYAAGLGLVFEG